MKPALRGKEWGTGDVPVEVTNGTRSSAPTRSLLTAFDRGERLLGPVRGRRPPIAPFSRAARNRRSGRGARPAASSGVAGRASACIGPLFSFPRARAPPSLSRLFSEATCFSFRLDCVPARFSGALGRARAARVSPPFEGRRPCFQSGRPVIWRRFLLGRRAGLADHLCPPLLRCDDVLGTARERHCCCEMRAGPHRSLPTPFSAAHLSGERARWSTSRGAPFCATYHCYPKAGWLGGRGTNARARSSVPGTSGWPSALIARRISVETASRCHAPPRVRLSPIVAGKCGAA